MAHREILNKSVNNSFVIKRQPSEYSDFLQIYSEVGYGPMLSQAGRASWEAASVATWRKLDAALPGSCTGGKVNNLLVSSWGMVPYGNGIAYAHSVCMKKSLVGAVTLFNQAIGSIDWARAHHAKYYGGSYNKTSSFVTKFQKLLPQEIDCQQVKIDSIQFDPLTGAYARPDNSLQIRDSANVPPQLKQLVSKFGKFTGDTCPKETMLHHVKNLYVTRRGNNVAIGQFVFHSAADLLTASNVLQLSWLFVECLTDAQIVIPFLRTIPEYAATGIQVVCCEKLTGIDINGEKRSEIFWVFTPSSLFDQLASSYRNVFQRIINKFSEEEIEFAAKMLGL